VEGEEEEVESRARVDEEEEAGLDTVLAGDDELEMEAEASADDAELALEAVLAANNNEAAREADLRASARATACSLSFKILASAFMLDADL